MFTNYFEPYSSTLQQWNNIILFAAVLGFWLSFALNRLPRKSEPIEYAYLEKVLAPFFWIPLFIMAIVLRLPLMDANPWYDETYTYLMATAKWSAFPSALLSDVHPPGFYMLERLVAIFGANMWALRLPSLIAGLALIWVVYRVSLVMFGSHQTAKLSAVIVTILPQTIYYSTEARYPALLAVVVLLAVLAVLEDKPHRFVILGALPIYLHSMGIFYAGLLMVGALLHRRSRQWIIASALVALLAVLWLPGILIQSQVVGNGFWLQLESPVTFITDMTTGRMSPSLFPLFGLWVLMFGLSFLALHRPQKNLLLWALLALGAPLAAWLVSMAWNPIYLPRSLMASTLLFIPIWADYLRRFRWLMVVSALLLLFPLQGLYTQNRAPIGNALELCKGADNVYALANTMAIPTRYYLPDTPVHIWELSNEVDLTTEFTPAIQAAFGFHITENPDELNNVCIPVGINPYTSKLELAELERLAILPGSHVQTVDAHDFAKYVVIRSAE